MNTVAANALAHSDRQITAWLRGLLTIAWADGEESYLDFETLRRACPCASCCGEPDATGRVVRPVVTYTDKSFILTSYQTVGGYALQLRFADGHGVLRVADHQAVHAVADLLAQTAGLAGHDGGALPHRLRRGHGSFQTVRKMDVPHLDRTGFRCYSQIARQSTGALQLIEDRKKDCFSQLKKHNNGLI